MTRNRYGLIMYKNNFQKATLTIQEPNAHVFEIVVDSDIIKT